MPASLTTLFFLTMFIAPTITEQSIDEFNRETNVYFGDNWANDLVRADSAVSMSRSIGYEYGEAYALYQKGYVQDELNESGSAFISNLSALRLIERRDSEKVAKLKVSLYINTGLILRQHFKYNEAIRYFSEGLATAESYELKEDIAELHYKIGNAHRRQGNLDVAIDHLVQAYNLSIDFEDDYLAINSLNLLGMLHTTNGDYEQARAFFDKMLNFEFRMSDADKYHGFALHNLAETYLKEGDTKMAEQYLLEALEKKTISSNDRVIFITEIELVDLYLNSEDFEKAVAMSESSLKHYKNLRKSPEFYEIFSLLRKAESGLGNHSQSQIYASRFEEESAAFTGEQQELMEISDQFKMDILTVSYFSELERERRIANLTSSIYFIILFIFIGFTLWKIRQLYNRRVLERELRTAIHDLNIDDL